MLNILRALVLLIGPIVGYLIGGRSLQGAMIGLGMAAVIVAVELILSFIQLDVMVFGFIGALGGAVLAIVSSWIVARIDDPTIHKLFDDYGVLFYGLLAVLGFMVGVKKKGELDLLDKNIVVKKKDNKDVKILDTSVLIDGRISDVVGTGFLAGRLLVPSFVLHELQTVADSSDATKRQRGRRGLDILKMLQEEKEISIKIYEKDYPAIKEVDSKLIELAKEMGAKIATTDFNLNKVAVLQGVSVLNINDLAAALKPVVLPGDQLTIYLSKEGKEKAQAVGYLDDGTMIVVDDARRLIGKRVGIAVNSILQTSAGRMIFARLQENNNAPSASEEIHPPSA